uniref:Ig-like domain-containing protein n=1 Tax=Heterorhabditis bacteriophora TaxID=37862 RepID=A0A1I7X580_HETBA
MFTPMNVKVFNREAFIINGTETGTLSRSNLFAWTFPKSYPPNKLVYHIEEPPKYGILSRKVGKKNRRIGVSSNFTQEDIDNVLISYRLHFMQYSIVNDFFLFRVVSPAMSSESLRFEIIFVPTPTSIQLVNRTVVIQEGELTMVCTMTQRNLTRKWTEITSDSLSLSTSDDKHFVFSITILPYHGSLLLKKNGGGKVALSQGSNFTTKDVEEGRVFYSHSGSETRSDRMYLTAESAFRKGRRIPFWVSFSIILLNDNLPRLDGSNVIQKKIVERGERILYPHLLKWTDDDSDSVPLEFNFHYPIKDAAILSTVSPYLPTTLFSQSDLMERKIMIRHLGHKRNVSINYSVNDGKHTVEGTLLLVASDPFVRVEESMLEYCCLPGDTPELSIGSSNLSVITNLDVKPEDIQYFASTNNFLLRTSNDKKIVRKFTQKDIDDGNMRYSVGKVENESLKIIIGNRTLQSEMHISRRSLGSSLELRRASTLNIPVGVAVIIDSLHLEQGDGVTEADRLWYHVVRQPQEGTLVLENEGNPVFPLLHVTRFSQQDVDRGRLQYIHGGGGSGRDTIEFNITSPHITKGPFILYLEIYEHHVSLNTSPLHVVSGESAVISITVINVTSSDKDDYVLKILQRPSYGWIVKDSWSMNNISSIESFTGADLRERRVVFVSDRETAAKSDWFSVIACISQDTCTSAKTVDVLLSQRNMQSPQLLRNEILRLSGDKALITNSHLDTEDPDTPSSEVFFLISRPSIGIVVDVNDQEKAIYNFSQRDIDDSNIIFVKNTIIKHFNSIYYSRPEEVLFSITKHPKHGKILVNGKSSDKFSQNEFEFKVS